MELVLIAIFVLVLAAAARPLGLNVADRWTPPIDSECVYNAEANADIIVGTAVSRYPVTSETVRSKAAAERFSNIILPTASYPEFAGILVGNDGRQKTVNNGEIGRLVRRGVVQARVKVPASTNLATGTKLVVATAWDSTNNLTLFATSSASANPGVLEPVIINSVLLRPWNPVATLLEPLTATSAQTIQTAWVNLTAYHRPLPMILPVNLHGTVADLADFLLAIAKGPYLVTHVAGQFLAHAGTPGGPQTFNVEISPLLGTPDQQAALSSAISVGSNSTAGRVFGAACSLIGDTDSNNTLGTGVDPVLAAENLRVGPTQSILTGTVDVPASNPDTDFFGVVELLAL